MICFRAQVDHRRVLAELELRQPTGAVAQPLDLIAQPLGDQLAAGQLPIATIVGVLRCRPAVQRTQLTQRCGDQLPVARGVLSAGVGARLLVCLQLAPFSIRQRGLKRSRAGPGAPPTPQE